MVDLYADMFELAPVSLWLEDYSALKSLFERWRAEGVRDLRAHLREDRARVAECSRCLQVLRVNRRTLQLYGAQTQDELVANLPEVFRDDMFEQLVEELAALWDGRLGFASQTVNYSLTGKRLAILLNATVLPGHEHDWGRVLLAIEDVTERSRAERALRASEQYAKGLFEHSPVSLWVEDFSTLKQLLDEVRAQGIDDFRTFIDVHPEFVTRCMQEIRVIDVNRQTLTMFRAPDKSTLLGSLERVFRDDMRAHFAEQLVDLWNGKLFQQREVLNYALDGEPVHVYLQFSVLPGHEQRWDQVLVSLTDITARKKAEAYLEYLGKHDVLTGLRNRAFFVDELSRLERKGPWPVTAIVVDLNGLKSANDEGGHAAGDALLRRVGQVLDKLAEEPDMAPPAADYRDRPPGGPAPGLGRPGTRVTASRIGGDEFAVLLPGADERRGEQTIEQLHELLALNNQFHGGEPLSLALGMATTRDGERLELAIHRADAQMYAAKREHYAQRRNDRRGATQW